MTKYPYLEDVRCSAVKGKTICTLNGPGFKKEVTPSRVVIKSVRGASILKNGTIVLGVGACKTEGRELVCRK